MSTGCGAVGLCGVVGGVFRVCAHSTDTCADSGPPLHAHSSYLAPPRAGLYRAQMGVVSQPYGRVGRHSGTRSTTTTSSCTVHGVSTRR
jgi:hypothetical protein